VRIPHPDGDQTPVGGAQTVAGLRAATARWAACSWAWSFEEHRELVSVSLPQPASCLRSDRSCYGAPRR
jgi:hypothetical protein